MGGKKNVNVCTTQYLNDESFSLGPLCSLRQLLHDVDELVSPVPGRADVDAEEVLLGGGGHGERVPLQVRDGRAVEENVLAHLHLKATLHQLQLQHLGRPHDDLETEVSYGVHHKNRRTK